MFWSFETLRVDAKSRDVQERPRGKMERPSERRAAGRGEAERDAESERERDGWEGSRGKQSSVFFEKL
jgi:hypothetical protein